MALALGLALVALGSVLFWGAAWLAGAAARDSRCRSTPRGPIAPSPRPLRHRGHHSAAGRSRLPGTMRWRNLDREFRNNAPHKPLPVAATTAPMARFSCFT